MRTCPNANCRLIHDDSVGQCPECGANMGRTPDAPRDPNMELYAMRDRAMRDASLEARLKRGDTFDAAAPVQVKEAAADLAEATAEWMMGRG